VEDGAGSGEQAATGNPQAATRKAGMRRQTAVSVSRAPAAWGASVHGLFPAWLFVPPLHPVLLPTTAAWRDAPRNACPTPEMRAAAADLVGAAGPDAGGSRSIGLRRVLM
jgi:hypothetical protein